MWCQFFLGRCLCFVRFVAVVFTLVAPDGFAKVFNPFVDGMAEGDQLLAGGNMPDVTGEHVDHNHRGLNAITRWSIRRVGTALV